MIVLVIAKLFLFMVVLQIDSQVMLMEMKHPDHEKHKQQTEQANARGPLNAIEFVKRMWQQIQQRDTEHHAGDKT